MGLGDADTEIAEAIALERVDLLSRRRVVVDAVGAIDLRRHRLDLLPQCRLCPIQEAEGARLARCLPGRGAAPPAG